MGKHRHPSSSFPGRSTVVATAAAAAVAGLVIAGGTWGAGSLREAAPGSPTAVWSSAEPSEAPRQEAGAPAAPTAAGQVPAPTPTPSPPPVAQAPPETSAPIPDPPGTPSPPDSAVTRTPAESEPGRSRPPPPATDLAAVYSTSETWEDGFQASISLSNSAATAEHVEVVLVFPAGVRLRGAAECWWDVNCQQRGRTVTLTTTSPLAPGTRRFVGFNAVRTPGSNPFEPVECTIAGAPCDGF